MRWARLTAVGFLFWLILTAGMGWWTVLIGLAIAGLVAVLKIHMLATDSTEPTLSGRETLGMIGYALGMIALVLPAAWRVAMIVMRRDLNVHPGVLYHRTTLTRPIARTALANSITLTPGTHCVDLDDDRLVIHYLNPNFTAALDQHVLERRLAAILERPA